MQKDVLLSQHVFLMFSVSFPKTSDIFSKTLFFVKFVSLFSKT